MPACIQALRLPAYLGLPPAFTYSPAACPYSSFMPACIPEMGKVTLKSKGDEALSDEFLLKSNGDEAFIDVSIKSIGDEAFNAQKKL